MRRGWGVDRTFGVRGQLHAGLAAGSRSGDHAAGDCRGRRYSRRSIVRERREAQLWVALKGPDRQGPSLEFERPREERSEAKFFASWVSFRIECPHSSYCDPLQGRTVPRVGTGVSAHRQAQRWPKSRRGNINAVELSDRADRHRPARGASAYREVCGRSRFAENPCALRRRDLLLSPAMLPRTGLVRQRAVRQAKWEA